MMASVKEFIETLDLVPMACLLNERLYVKQL